jgi:hypothetical protein
MVFSGKDASFLRVRSLGKIFLYAFCVLLVGALVAPQAWHLIQMMPGDWLHGLLGDVQRMPFHRYLSRSMQVVAILLLWPLLHSLHIRSLEELGLTSSRCMLRDLAAGFLAGIPSFLVLLVAFLISGAFELHIGWHAPLIPRIILTSVVVALVEEFLFRGVILGFLRQFLGTGVAIIVSAVIFATLHFLNLPSSGAHEEAPSWWSGLVALTALGKGLPPWPILGWAFATLFFAGILLGWMTTQTGALWASIALHGSWIFGQQFFNSLSSYRHIPPDAFLPFVAPAQCHGAVAVGLDALFALLIAALLAVILLRKRQRPHQYNLCSR